jgi:alpha-tubulin suppressor-like RCC1 family protein
MLGDGTTITRTTPVRVEQEGGVPITGVSQVSPGAMHSCAASGDGSAWCWGDARHGQLGDGTTIARDGAVRVTRAGGRWLQRVVGVSAGGGHSCAVSSGGSAWCWGANSYGQLGDGTTTGRSRAVKVRRSGGGALSGVVAVSAGDDHSCAVTSDHAVWCWGRNRLGQVGDGSTNRRLRAVLVTKVGGSVLAGVTSVSAGERHTCARTGSGAAWCWGRNDHGQLGDGTTVDRRRAVRVTRQGGWALTGVTAISAGSDHACARMEHGSALCWGLGNHGQLGDGTTMERHRAVAVLRADGQPLTGVRAIGAGYRHSCAQSGGDAAWCWGLNRTGQLGDGTSMDRHRAVRVVPTWADGR